MLWLMSIISTVDVVLPVLPVLDHRVVFGHAESSGAGAVVDLGIAERRAEIDLVQFVAEPIRPAVFIGLVSLAAFFGPVAPLCALSKVAENLVERPATHLLLTPRPQFDAPSSGTCGFAQVPLVLEVLKEIIECVVRL